MHAHACTAPRRNQSSHRAGRAARAARLPGARRRRARCARWRARGVDARGGRAVDLQPRRALRRLRRRRPATRDDLRRLHQRVPRRRPADGRAARLRRAPTSTRRAICSASPPASTRWSSASRRSSARSRTRTRVAGDVADRRAGAQPAVPLVVRRRQARADRDRARPGAVSVSFAAVALARKIFGDLERPERRSSSAPARWAS